MLCRIYLVRGRVQGVGFRNFVQRNATAIGVAGYARNLADGTVEVIAQGSAQQLDELEAHLWRGPAWAQVTGVEAAEHAVHRNLNGFGIRS